MMPSCLNFGRGAADEMAVNATAQLDNRRVAAAVVDLLIVVAVGAVVLYAGDALSGDRREVWGALLVVTLGWALFYYFALESGDGQTLGKKLLNLRVVRADGQPAGMREIAVRTVLRVVDGIGAYIVGLVVMLATGQRRQRLGDLAAGTIVVDAAAASGAPAVTPAVEAPVADEQAEEETEAEVEAEPEAEPAPAATITLPARPAPPATVADLSSDTPAAPELRPFPPVDEPEEPVAEVAEPVVEAVPAPEPAVEVAEEPAVEVAEEPVVEAAEPVVEAVPVVEVVEVAEEPVVEAAEEPVVEVVEPVAEAPAEEPLPEIASPSIEELARDVEGVQGEDEPVTLKSVETISAMDLIMGGASEEEQEDAAS
jgi:uncharacterized RDD family membrane protein YckC